MIHWAAYDPRTGVLIEELPGLRVTSSLSQIIGRGDSATVELPVTDRLPDRWELATAPGRVVIAGIVPPPHGASPSDASVLWAGWPDRREYGDGPVIKLRLQPPEELLARNYVPNLFFTQVADTTIMRSIGLDFAAAQFHGDVTVEAVGKLRDRTEYLDDADKTRLTAMQELMAVRDGPEFALTWRIDSAGRLCLVARTAPMLGRRSASILVSRSAWASIEDYSEGKGATKFTGVSTRTGDTRVTSTYTASALIAGGYLQIERRWQPDTSATNPDTIASYVTAAYTAQQYGTQAYTVSMHLDDVVPSRDFGLGDDVSFDLRNPDLGVAVSLTKRLVGWVADPDPDSGDIVSVSPILMGAET